MGDLELLQYGTVPYRSGATAHVYTAIFGYIGLGFVVQDNNKHAFSPRRSRSSPLHSWMGCVALNASWTPPTHGRARPCFSAHVGGQIL